MTQEELEEIVSFQKADGAMISRIEGSFARNLVNDEILIMKVNPFEAFYDWCDVVDVLDDENIPVYLICEKFNDEPLMLVYAVDKERILESVKVFVENL